MAHPDQSASHTFAVFPFLKTLHPVLIGGVLFRSTDDRASLAPDQAEHISKLAAMLYLKDDLRLRSASYAAIPFVNFNRSTEELELDEIVLRMKNIQALVAYYYAQIHEPSGDCFFRSRIQVLPCSAHQRCQSIQFVPSITFNR
jgi:hypothetical protein